MANKGISAFEEFTAGVVARITDPDQRRRAEESIATLKTITPVAQALGDGIAGQSEIDRQLQTLSSQRTALETQQQELADQEARLSQWHGQLTDWHAQFLTEQQRLRQNGGQPNSGGNPAATTPQLPKGVITEEAMGEVITRERQAFLGYQRDQNAITREHFDKFKEIVNVEELMMHPKIQQLGLVGVYREVHKARLDQYEADAQKKREDEIRADERAKTLQGQAQMPYPSPTGAGSGSPLDALGGQSSSVVDSAVAEYNRLQLERVGASR